MKTLFAILTILLALTIAAPASALELHRGSDTYGLDTWYDLRTYHESHPGSQIADNPGGWVAVLTVLNSDKAALIDNVTMEIGPSPEGATGIFKFTSPMAYNWFGDTNYDYGIMNGNKNYTGQDITLTATDIDGNPVEFFDGVSLGTVLTKTIPLGTPAPPVCKIKRMAIKRSGDLVVRFTAPEVDYNSQIRIRVFDQDGGGIHQIKIDPPYEIIKKDTTIIPDKLKVFVPGEYAGHTARIEYRIFDENGFMARGITNFVLPSLEE